MLDILKKIFPKKTYLGVDIGTTSIKVAELRRENAILELINYGFLESYGHLERLNNALQTSTLKMLDQDIIELLKILVKDSGLKSTDAVASIPAFSAFTTLLEIPIMSQADTARAMQFQAKQYIPLPIAAVTIDWLKVGERTDPQGNKIQQVLLVSVPNEQIQKYKTIFKAAGLNLMSLEIEGLSSARILTDGNKETTLILDIGSRSTSISIAKDGYLKFVGQTDFAGGSLTQTIASGLNIRVRRAEDLKKLRGLQGTGGEYELSTLMLPIMDVIINEAQRVRNNYEKGYTDKVGRVVVSGGGANLIGVIPYIQDQMGLPTTKADPFSRIRYPSTMQPLVSELGPEFTVAIGLGVKLLS
ncbi:MAG: type IV pilus assembly protein PilM [Patescibacteria group bacterium]|nr:type IV pilus assembly protein PilM [Patescibacteria group bacterium]